MTCAISRHIPLALLATVILLIGVACSDDDVADPDVPAGTGSGTVEGGVPEGTPIERVTPMITPEAEAEESPGTEELPSPQETGTPLPLADRTVTPDSDEVGPQGESIFPDIRMNGPDLENYTLTIVGEIERTDAESDTLANVDLQYEQNAPDSFHLLFDADDEFVVETWRVGDDMWVREENEIEEAPQGFVDDFSIGSYLSMLPEIERISEAEEVGQEEIEGRSVTHYSVPGDEAVQYLPGMRDVEVQHPEGSIEIWLDGEENVVMRMIVDLTWMDAEHQENSTNLEYNVTAIDETEPIEPPTP